ncbi:hypothetical protein [Mycobacteroides abscessus]|uniref:hypothetical protein n=1 Tax=Mycobacteroides abscessus TaxID=36809 RepID=UPI00266DB170|nr:hypothetical protein [Mycobacteroides abscessus]MDO3331316.1 hypothetical protein [Mycobacteroides abscessus subsp. abscessus]
MVWANPAPSVPDRWAGGRAFECQVGHRLVKGVSGDVYARNEILRRGGASEHADELFEASDEFADIGYDAAVWGPPRRFVEDAVRARDVHRPPGLGREYAGIAASLPTNRTELCEFLSERAAHLNSTAPQTPPLRAFDAVDSTIRGFGGWMEWIDPRLIVRTVDRKWNSFTRRSESVPEIAEALVRSLESDDGLERWIVKMFCEVDRVSVIRVEGPAGPIYELNRGGSHRVHAARLLNLPKILVEVATASLPKPLREKPHWHGLRERGLIDAKISNGRWFFRGISAEWRLHDHAAAAAVDEAYTRCYPTTGVAP